LIAAVGCRRRRLPFELEAQSIGRMKRPLDPPMNRMAGGDIQRCEGVAGTIVQERFH
jgi:hypothetical protein